MTAYWERKSLNEMTVQEWEGLCDGCGKCCLHKLQDEADNQIYYTDVACRFLNVANGRCTDYANRLENVKACQDLTELPTAQFYWLPTTCAYRLLNEGKKLPPWHPLISGTRESVERAGISVAGRVVGEQDVEQEDWEERIVYWVDQ